MSNMSYCRFQNTLADLQDCHDALQDMVDYPDVEDNALSVEEYRAAVALLDLCHQFDAFEEEDLVREDAS